MTGNAKIPEVAPCRVPRICAMFGGTLPPWAIHFVLSRLPADFPIPILACQSLPSGFAKAFVAWLDESSPLTVKIAETDELAAPATVYVPPDNHLGVTRDGTVDLSDRPPINGYRPSSTYLFESVAKYYGDESVAVVFSDIPRDDVSALVGLHKAGGKVVLDESRSVVFGTQRAAIVAGAVDCVLPVEEIPDYLSSLPPATHSR